MRVLHLPVDVGSRTSHTVRGLGQKGVDAFGLVLKGFDVQYGYEYRESESLKKSRQRQKWFYEAGFFCVADYYWGALSRQGRWLECGVNCRRTVDCLVRLFCT